jgi:hypothetical protein
VFFHNRRKELLKMKPVFKSLYLSLVMCCICLSTRAASSSELITPTSSESSFEQQIAESMGKMDQDMAAAPMTGDPNHDFCAMMIPHQQGAIDMAKTFLLHGQDAALRRLATHRRGKSCASHFDGA